MRFKEILCRIRYGKHHKISPNQKPKPLPKDLKGLAKRNDVEISSTEYVECEFCGKIIFVPIIRKKFKS